MDKEHRVSQWDQRIKVLCIEFGPEFTLTGNSVHLSFFNAFFEHISQDSYGADISEPTFFFTVSGSLASSQFKEPIKDAKRRVYRTGGGLAFVNYGLSLKTVNLPQPEFRERFGKIIIDAAEAMVTYAQRKNLDFDQTRFLTDVEDAVAAYNLLDLPLPQEPGVEQIKLLLERIRQRDVS